MVKNLDGCYEGLFIFVVGYSMRKCLALCWTSLVVAIMFIRPSVSLYKSNNITDLLHNNISCTHILSRLC